MIARILFSIVLVALFASCSSNSETNAHFKGTNKNVYDLNCIDKKDSQKFVFIKAVPYRVDFSPFETELAYSGHNTKILDANCFREIPVGRGITAEPSSQPFFCDYEPKDSDEPLRFRLIRGTLTQIKKIEVYIGAQGKGSYDFVESITCK